MKNVIGIFMIKRNQSAINILSSTYTKGKNVFKKFQKMNKLHFKH